METIIQQKNIRQVIVALEKPEQAITENLISRLSVYDVEIKIVPDMLAILSGSVKVNNVPGAVLIDIDTMLMPSWQNNIKRLVDVAISLACIVFISPLYSTWHSVQNFLLAEDIIYSQERVGYKGKLFSYI